MGLSKRKTTEDGLPIINKQTDDGLPIIKKPKAPPSQNPFKQAGQYGTAYQGAEPNNSFAAFEDIFTEVKEKQDEVDFYMSPDMSTVQALGNQTYVMAAEKQKELDEANNKKKAFMKMRGAELYRPVQEMVKSGEFKKFFENGVYRADKAIEYFDGIVKANGGGSYVRDLLVSTLKQAGEYELDEPKRQALRDEEYKKQGIDISKYGKGVLDKLTAKQISTIEQLKKESEAKAAGKFSEARQVAVKAGTEYKAAVDNLSQLVKQGLLDEGSANEELQELNKDYSATLASIEKDYKAAVRDINIKSQSKFARIKKEIEEIGKGITGEQVWQSIPPEVRAKIEKINQSVEEKISSGKNTGRKVGDAMSHIMPGGLFGKSFLSGWYRGLSNLGNYLSSKGFDSSFIKYLQSKEYEADLSQTAQYDWSGDEWLNRAITSTGSSLGASAPIMLPAIGVTLASGGLGLPAFAGIAATGTLSYQGEKAMNTGEVYRQALDKTGDPNEAQRIAKDFEDKQLVLAPLYYLEAAGLKNLLSGSFKKALVGQAQELGQELPTEFYQGYTQEAALTGNDKGFLQYIKDNPETTLDTIVATIGQSGIIGGAAKIFNTINTSVPSAHKQYLADIINRHGIEFTMENLTQLHNTGVLSDGEFAQAQELALTTAAQLKKFDGLGLKGEDAKAYMALFDEVKGLEEQVNAEKDEAAKALMNEKLSAVKGELAAITKGKGSYAIVTMPGTSSTRVIPLSQLQEMETKGELDGLIKMADRIEIKGDNKLNEQYQQRKLSLGNPAGAPRGMYDNETKVSAADKKFVESVDAEIEAVVSENETVASEKIGFIDRIFGGKTKKVQASKEKVKQLKDSPESYFDDKIEEANTTLESEELSQKVEQLQADKQRYINIKQKLDAVQEREATQVSLDETPGDSKKVGEEIREEGAPDKGIAQEQPNVVQNAQVSDTTEVKSELPNPATEKAQSYGYSNEHEGLNSVNKRLGTEYKSFEDVSDEELQEASTSRNQERPTKEKFDEDMIFFAETVKDSSFDFRLDIPGLSQSERDGAIKDIRKGKQSVRRTRFEEALREMYDKGAVSMTRGRGNHVERIDIPFEDYFGLTPQEKQGAEGISDEIVRIIDAEGITLDNIDSLKDLFNGFPYDQSDFAAIKGYLSRQTKSDETGVQPTQESEASPEKISESKPDDGNKVKKTVLTTRAYEGNVPEQVKKYLEQEGLYRERVSQEERSRQATAFIDEFGEDIAFEAVKSGDVRGAVAASVISQLIGRNNVAMSRLTALDVAELDRLAKRSTELIVLDEKISFEGGEYNGQKAFEYETNADLAYNFEKKVQEFKDQNGGVIPKEVEEKFRALDTELKEVRKKLAEAEERAKIAEEQQAVLNIQESLQREKKSQAKKEYGEKALAVVSNLRKKIKANNYSDVTGMVAIVDTALGLIETSIKAGMKVSAAIEKGIAHIKGKLKEQGVETWEKEDQFRSDVIKEFEDAGIKDDPRPKPMIQAGGRLSIPERMIREYVEQGIDNIEDLTKAIHDELVKDLPEVTERMVRDAITHYGKTVNLNRDEVSKQIRKIKRIGRVLSALEDVQAKKRPLRSGMQRDKLDETERLLNKQLRELMKDLPLDEETKSSQLKTQLDAAKSRVQNQIEDLDKQIKDGKKIQKSKRTLEKDDELRQLERQRDELKKEFEKIFNDEAELLRQRVVAIKLATQKRIEELQRKLREKDFSKPAKKPLIQDSEVISLRAEKLRLQEEFDKEFEKMKLQQRTFWEKRRDDAWDAWQIPRTSNASGEASFVGIQGLKLTLSYIVRGRISVVGKAFKNAIRAFGSEGKSEEWLRNIKSKDWFPIAKASGLSLTEPSARITAREELGYSGYTDRLWNTLVLPLKTTKGKSAYEYAKKANPFKIPDKIWNKIVSPLNYEQAKKANPIRMFERAASGYLDTLRVARFVEGMEIQKDKGVKFEDNPQAYKDIADVVNTLTGRASIGFMERNPEIWTRVLYSPRNWASAVKTGTPYAFYHFGKMRAGATGMELSVAQRMAFADMSRMVGLTTGIVLLAAAFLNNDDDEETGVDFDFTSSNFAKIKIGKGRVVDPWGGMIQQVTLTSRLVAAATGNDIKASDGKFYPVGTPYKTPTVTEMAIQSATNKLNPTMGLIETYASSKVNSDGERKTKFGKELVFADELQERVSPIYWGTLADLNKDGFDKLDGFLAFWSFFGGGLQVQDKKEPKPQSSTKRSARSNPRSNSRKRDRD